MSAPTPAPERPSLTWLYGLQKFGMKLGLENIRDLCRLLGNPEEGFGCILVAGTNGKGSVSAMLEAILLEGGVRTGLYTSPHLVRPEERIRIAGRDIDEAAFEQALARVRGVIDPALATGDLARHPTFFEVMTAMAFEAFAKDGVDIAVLEVGLGGRFDATNVVDPFLSIVTGIDLDHQEQLGGDLASIAREKAGVFRSVRPAVIGEGKPVPVGVLDQIARRLGTPVVHVPSETQVLVTNDGLDFAAQPGLEIDPAHPGSALPAAGMLRLDLATPGHRYRDLHIPLPGVHQATNVATAVRAAEVISKLGLAPLDEPAVRSGLAATRWPGRLEWVRPAAGPPLLLDCAHNPAGAAALAEALRAIARSREDGSRSLVLVFGAMRDKDYATMAGELGGMVGAVVATRPRIDRAATEVDALAAFQARFEDLPASAVPDAIAAIGAARGLAGPRGIVCVAGSIFLVGEVRERLGELSDFAGGGTFLPS